MCHAHFQSIAKQWMKSFSSTRPSHRKISIAMDNTRQKKKSFVTALDIANDTYFSFSHIKSGYIIMILHTFRFSRISNIFAYMQILHVVESEWTIYRAEVRERRKR